MVAKPPVPGRRNHIGSGKVNSIFGKLEIVETGVGRQRKAVVGVGCEEQFGVGIVKKSPIPVCGRRKPLNQKVWVSQSPAHQQTQFFGDQRAVGHKPAGERANSTRVSPPIHAPRPNAHHQQRRQPTAVTGRHSAFVERYILHNIGIHAAQKTKQMAGVEERGIVEQNQVLIHAPTPHIDAARPLAHRCHAGLQREGFQNITLAKHHRNPFDLLNTELYPAHLNRPHIAVFLPGFHLHFV